MNTLDQLHRDAVRARKALAYAVARTGEADAERAYTRASRHERHARRRCRDALLLAELGDLART